MAKKQKKDKKEEEILDKSEADAVEENVSETETALSESDAVPADVDPDDVRADVDDSLDDVSSDDEELSPDDLLDDVRRSLIEEGAKDDEEKKKKTSWWQKLGVGKQKAETSDEMSEVADESVDVDVTESSDDATANVVMEDVQDDVGDSIDDLIEMLEFEDAVEEAVSNEDFAPEPVQVEYEEPEPEPEQVDVDELKKRAFKGSTPDDTDENFNDVRAVALEGGDEVFVEIEVKAEDPVEDRIKSFENALRPYRRYISFGIAFVGLIAIIATSALLYDAYQKTLPPEPTQVVSNLPRPVVLNLPGGLTFNLGRGNLVDGKWNPRGPEWLEGTEICRWVAIPYSAQVEAVMLTLTRNDKLELVMSNSDRLEYDVFSRTQMTIEDMQAVSLNRPCLLLVLADAKTDTRWVITAYP